MSEHAMAVPMKQRWWREPWPWLLMAGPVAAVLGGIATAWIAFSHQDGLVVDDYYRQGLAINRTLERSRAAARLGLRATVTFAEDGRRVRVILSGLAPLPETVQLRLAHATRSGLDQNVALRRTGDWYEGELVDPAAGKWNVLVEDMAHHWRLSGLWQTDGDRVAALDAGPR
ncbi:MAG: FixH family protein [Burkholderiales bacterium]|nr:FixH family protein [Burkholderiales bacterium]